MNRHERELRPADRDSVAAEWVARCDAGLSGEERREFESWRTAAPENAETFNRLSSAWRAMGRPRRTGTSAALLDELGALRGRDRRRRRRAVSIAAMLGCVVASGWWIRARHELRGGMPANTVVIAPERQVLTDGSAVEYARGTELEISYSAAVRRVVLKRGDAHFQVTSNPARPFVVSVNGIDVQAVGTAFAVRASATAVDIVVTEGRVAVEQARDPSAPRSLAVLDQGSGVRVDVTAATTATPVPPSGLAERLSWRSPKLEFSGVPLADVVAVLNRYNSSQLVLEDPQIRDVLLSGMFRADDIESLLNTLATGFGIVAERHGRQILLRKAK
jgi:transmembrane sensor